ncbi:hypothetical protein BDV34DRAFT_222947 [Aspergillus parasiticus]|uniref:Uncharacterized protein n=1 Tax=Aspergillus parasiticus TaxID=5067 RepID=A0A5N6DSP7_ASPPA|nr:hypothetical protein BDV34DRAFT_222947 [Aspergillus parasiticus]
MSAISELVSTFNDSGQSVSAKQMEDLGQWITQIVNILGLNGTASPEGTEIGWRGTDIPEPAKPFVYPLSTMRDVLRSAAMSQNELSVQQLDSIVATTIVDEDEVSVASKPYFQVLKNFRTE